MAQTGSSPPANRYDGIGVGPTFAYTFESQEGIPMDGTNAILRDLSPFVLRLVPPDALLEMASTSEAEAVDLIQAAALGASTATPSRSVASMLSTVTATGTTGNPTGQLESFVANGQFFTDADAAFVSSLADAYVAADIALQLQRILEAEPLTLLVNPTTMSVQWTKLQSYQSRTRFGFVFEAWGEEQAVVTFSGTTAGFVAGAVDTSSPYGAQVTGATSSVSGYQAAARRDSAAWQNFMSLYHFYKNNGYIYDTVGKSMAHLFVGAVAIDYDQWTYLGHIDSFSYRFDEGSPHKVEFDLEFKASRVYDRAQSSSVVMPLRSPTPSPSSTFPLRSGSTTTTFASGQTAARSPAAAEYAQPALDNVLRRS
jgi:hypothetical protein